MEKKISVEDELPEAMVKVKVFRKSGAEDIDYIFEFSGISDWASRSETNKDEDPILYWSKL